MSQVIQGKWKEITKERFHYLMESVPPLKWTHTEQIETFFLGERFTANLYTCCVRDKKSGKYYSALREITMPVEAIQTDYTSTL